MSKLLIDKLTETKEGLRLYQQERTIVEITELICRLMEEYGISRSDLAARLKKTKGYISQLLDGDANMTVRTVSDLLTALGFQLNATASPLNVEWGAFDSELLDPLISADQIQAQAECAYNMSWDTTPVDPGCEQQPLLLTLEAA